MTSPYDHATCDHCGLPTEDLHAYQLGVKSPDAAARYYATMLICHDCRPGGAAGTVLEVRTVPLADLWNDVGGA